MLQNANRTMLEIISKINRTNTFSNHSDIYCDEADNRIPVQTIEILARNSFRECLLYGFKLWDYVRFVNMLLRNSIENNWDLPSFSENENDDKYIDVNLSFSLLSLNGKRIKIRVFEKTQDMDLFEKWLDDKNGRHFLMPCSTARKTTLNNLIKSISNIFGVVTLFDNTPIGSVAFLHHDALQ